MSPVRRARARARSLLFGSAVCFGLSAVLARLASRPGGMDGGQVTFVRFLLGAVAVGAVFRLRPGTFLSIPRTR